MLDGSEKSCVPCGLHQPMRNNYFDGKFLVARDFSDEQDYHRGHRQMHNAFLHGAGTVCGLRLIQHPSEQCRREFLVIEPGLALDCCGQEIIVPERSLVRVRELIGNDEDLQAQLDGEHHLFIAIQRCDSGAEPVPIILPTCEGSGGTECGRVAEGFEFCLFARLPSEVQPVEVPIQPRLDWVHSFTYDGGTPRAVHLNDAEGLVQVASDDAAGTRAYAYERDTHDLSALLRGPERSSDTGASREARLVFVAGSDFASEAEEDTISGVGVWQANTMRDNPDPVGVIPTAGNRPRIAVSPSSGTLYVLDIDGNASRLVSYTNAALTDWLSGDTSDPPEEGQSMAFGHNFGGPGEAADRGAAMMEITRDGRFLAISSPIGAAGSRLYVIDTTTFASGTLTPENARPEGYAPEANERIEAIRWTFDDSFLYVLTRQPAAGGTLLLNRYALNDEGAQLERAGRGAAISGTAFDLALAPTETRAYLLMADPDGITRLTTINLEEVIASSTDDEPVPLDLSPDAIRFEGAGRNLTPVPNGNRIYVAVSDDPEEAPERGLVAVIDIDEEDCTLLFDEAIDGCPVCEDDDHKVVLGHLEGYVWDPDDGPLIVDPGNGGEGAVEIDNLTFRPIVPSASTLRDVIECIVAQGVAEGPPGPRGDPGTDGANGINGEDGTSITDVTLTLSEPGSEAEVETVEGEDGLTVNITLPAAQDGVSGEGIDDATIEYRDDITDPEVAIVEEDGQRILDIDLPEPQQGGGLEPGIGIIAISWVHGQQHPVAPLLNDFLQLLRDDGIAVAFEREVLWRNFTGSEEPGPTMLAELQAPMVRGSGTISWEMISPLIAEPIEFDGGQIDGTLLTGWNAIGGVTQAQGFALRSSGLEFDSRSLAFNLPFRLVFYADFATDDTGSAVDGNHLGGRLPTGPTGPGNTFRSWFFVNRDNDEF